MYKVESSKTKKKRDTRDEYFEGGVAAAIIRILEATITVATGKTVQKKVGLL